MESHRAEKIAEKTGPEPMVGIFWLLNGELIFDVTPVSSAEPYGDCVGHAKSHISFWTELQEAGVIPLDVEYEEPPRGRVVFNLKTRQYIVYADKCIRAKSAIMGKIIRDFALPVELAVVSSDEHYRCGTCLYGDASLAH